MRPKPCQSTLCLSSKPELLIMYSVQARTQGGFEGVRTNPLFWIILFIKIIYINIPLLYIPVERSLLVPYELHS